MAVAVLDITRWTSRLKKAVPRLAGMAGMVPRLVAGAAVEAATDTLVEEGHAGLTLRRVAQRAGLSVGNLQYYFPRSRTWCAPCSRATWRRPRGG